MIFQEMWEQVVIFVSHISQSYVPQVVIIFKSECLILARGKTPRPGIVPASHRMSA